MDFDLESLVNVEQKYVELSVPILCTDYHCSFYDDGYRDGFAHGKIHGSIEGRALGREKGFEMWEELGFYEGFALIWQAVHPEQGGSDE